MTIEASIPPWHLIHTESQFLAAVKELERGSGPLAIDTERASGFTYRNNAYLIQLHREGSDIFLVDPLRVDSLPLISEIFSTEEWILHAATQDLTCLREAGLTPRHIFDTELAARLLGYDRVGLGSILESTLGVSLEKAHSAADWSRRPLPEPWLEYAALDVALLPKLRVHLVQELNAQHKLDFAFQEFDALVHWQPKQSDAEPWRRMSGLNSITQPRNLAIARELWRARDGLAQERDIAPGRLLPDSSIIAAASQPPRSQSHLASLKLFHGRASRSELPRWWRAIIAGKTTDDLPSRVRRNQHEIPPHRLWSQRFPEADARLKHARAALAEVSDVLNIPLENLLTPETLRRVAWDPPARLTGDDVGRALELWGARPWQVRTTAEVIARAFTEVAEGKHADGSSDANEPDARSG